MVIRNQKLLKLTRTKVSPAFMHFSLSIQEIADITKGDINGTTAEVVTGINKIESAQPGEVTFLGAKSFERYLAQTRPTCILLARGSTKPDHIPVAILVDNPYEAYLALLQFVDKQRRKSLQGIHNTAVVHETATVDSSSYIGPNVVIGANCTIGAHVTIHAGAVLYSDCVVGSNTIIHGNVTCYHETIIGEHCVLQSGAVIGSDGFGFVEREDKSFVRIPQIGNVVIGNWVDVGANSTIDRAALGSTIIADGVKIDNLVQIAHNVEIGQHSAIVAQVGISGSTKIGAFNRIAGQVGIVGHIETADNVVVEAQSGVGKSIEKAGRYFGSPAIPARQGIRVEMAKKELPEALRDIRAMQKDIEELKRDRSAES